MKANGAPAEVMPNEMRAAFTMDGTAKVLSQFHDDSVDHAVIWSRSYVDEFLANFTPENILQDRHGPEPYPGAARLFVRALTNYPVVGMSVAVIGSISPWVEAILINFGASSVTTVEYNVPECVDPRIRAVSYEQFTRGSECFDAIVTYSSVEHSGLGRYGESLDPDGDLHAMREILRHLKSGALVYWGAPVGEDVIVWNAHRIYGPKRLDLLFRGFRRVEWFWETSPSSAKFRRYRASAKSLLTGGGFRRDLFEQPLVVLQGAVADEHRNHGDFDDPHEPQPGHR